MHLYILFIKITYLFNVQVTDVNKVAGATAETLVANLNDALVKVGHHIIPFIHLYCHIYTYVHPLYMYIHHIYTIYTPYIHLTHL